MAYDSECWNLAEHFLTGENLGDKEKEITDALAQCIQDAVEDFVSGDLPLLQAWAGVRTGQ
jgi:hypothetical protein